MEDISSLIWLGIAIVWFLSKLVSRGVKKATASQKKPPRATFSLPESRQPPARSTASQPRIESQSGFSTRGGTAPPPIVPR